MAMATPQKTAMYRRGIFTSEALILDQSHNMFKTMKSSRMEQLSSCGLSKDVSIFLCKGSRSYRSKGG